MKRKTFFALVSLLAILLVLAACAPKPNVNPKDPVYTKVTLLPFNESTFERMPFFYNSTLYFVGNGYDIYQVGYNNISKSWGTSAVPIPGEVNGEDNVLSPCVFENAAGETVMYFTKNTSDKEYDVFRAVLVDGNWSNITRIAELSSNYKEWKIWVNSDETVAYINTNAPSFAADESGTKTSMDIWKSEKVDDNWTTPVKVNEVSTSADEWSPFVDAAGKIWFYRGEDIYYYDPSTLKTFELTSVNTSGRERAMWVGDKYTILTVYARPDFEGIGSYDLAIISNDYITASEVTE